MKQIKYIVMSAIVIFFCNACGDFGDDNLNENQPPYWSLSPYNLMEEVINSGFDGFLNYTFTLNGELIQYTISGSSMNAYHRFQISNTLMGSVWNSLFVWASNAEHMRQLSRVKVADVNCEAIATTLEVLYLSNATDIFGDIPCSEAFKGLPHYDDNDNYVDKNLILNPKFDAQRDVYEKLYAMLEKANSLYTKTQNFKYKGKDLLYGGDVDKWKKFNNSLYLRLLMRLSNRDEEKIVLASDGITKFTVLEKIREMVANPLKYPVFSSNLDNATLRFTGDTPFVNRFESSTMGSKRACNTLINMMTSKDLRISSYFQLPAGMTTWVGGESGIGFEEINDVATASMNRKVFTGKNSPYAAMKYDEVLFILSEAAYKGVIPGGHAKAKEYYEAGIEASFLYWFTEDPSGNKVPEEVPTIVSRYLEYAPYNYEIEQIMKQKYIALFWVGYEAWHDYRRTGYPRLTINSGTFNNHILPMRLEYPINITTTNPVNYRNAVERLNKDYGGADNMRTPVWWSLEAKSIK